VRRLLQEHRNGETAWSLSAKASQCSRTAAGAASCCLRGNQVVIDPAGTSMQSSTSPASATPPSAGSTPDQAGTHPRSYGSHRSQNRRLSPPAAAYRFKPKPLVRSREAHTIHRPQAGTAPQAERADSVTGQNQ
jgi:hypothetical protein